MYKIKNTTLENAQYEQINNILWDTKYNGKVFFKLAYDNEGLSVHFKIEESNPLREKTNHFESVCQDSCVEFFAIFTPDTSNKYLNLEVNANGAMYGAIRTGRADAEFITAEEINSLNITPQINDDYWTVTYKIPFGIIKKYFPDFDIQKCDKIKCNIYKCGDKTEAEHYLAYFKVGTPTPDFHQSKYFDYIELEK